MNFNFCYQKTANSIPLIFITEETLTSYLKACSSAQNAWIKVNKFQAKSGAICLMPATDSSIATALVGVKSLDDLWSVGSLPSLLPEGIYHIATKLTEQQSQSAELAWGLGSYRFERYLSSSSTKKAFLAVKTNIVRDAILQGIYLTRDLINTPTNDMGPKDLALTSKNLAKKYQARFKEIVGDDLLKQNYPAIHAVGRASAESPRLIELEWGNKKHPKITLVGKGVCFDSGGLDIKPSNNMRLMKKDMGGAAHALGLAAMIMETKLPVHLQVFIPAVENAISGNSFRPGDILTMRNGKTVEIDNTDAEGRLVLADALTEASRRKPKLIIDFATLTGAARVALGTDIPVMFSNDDNLAEALFRQGQAVDELIWRLPLYQGYEKHLNSPFADMVNSSETPYGGAITAALFLQRFIENNVSWVHFDIMAWNLSNQPARPQGGEAMGLRAVFQYIFSKFRDS